eukprot:Platyproteum_vivax@DN1877_c0_g1_i1.p1
MSQNEWVEVHRRKPKQKKSLPHEAPEVVIKSPPTKPRKLAFYKSQGSPQVIVHPSPSDCSVPGGTVMSPQFSLYAKDDEGATVQDVVSVSSSLESPMKEITKKDRRGHYKKIDKKLARKGDRKEKWNDRKEKDEAGTSE